MVLSADAAHFYRFYCSHAPLCEKLAIIPAVFTSTEAEGGISKTLKIRQIEPEFMARMFAVGEL